MQFRVTEHRVAEREEGGRQVRVVRVSLARENILVGDRNRPVRAKETEELQPGIKRILLHVPTPFLVPL